MSPSVGASPTHRSPDKASNDPAAKFDLEFGLWQEAPFVQLPADAPPEFQQMVIDIDDPRCVYAIHQASRRRDFQVLVQKFVHQLRYGCGSRSCLVPTCFSCRKRLAGKAPIRRYSPASARTFAMYLSSRDNPVGALCPAIRMKKEVSEASLNNIVFESRSRHVPFPHEPHQSQGHATKSKSKRKHHAGNKHGNAAGSGLGDKAGPKPEQPSTKDSTPNGAPPGPEESPPTEYEFAVRERPSNKDHRSFAANVFGTVAFRMLEWLTPQGHATMRENWSAAHMANETYSHPSETPKTSSLASPRTEPDSDLTTIVQPMATLANEIPDKLSSDESLSSTSNTDSSRSRRNSEALVRNTQQPSNPVSRKSLDRLPQESVAEEPLSPTISSKMSFKKSSTGLPRNIVEISKTFENMHLQNPPPSVTAVETNEIMQSEAEGDREALDQAAETKLGSKNHGRKAQAAAIPAEVYYPLPQSLSHLNTAIVEFICNIFEEDETSESHPHDEFESREGPPRQRTKVPLRRQKLHGEVPRMQWKAFNEQTLFLILSSPAALMASFTERGRLYDSENLCYNMRRLTLAKPTLVFHCLWMAAEILFHPPTLSYMQEPKGVPILTSAMSDSERACVLSICLHALIGAIPVPNEPHMVGDMSLIRSKGLTLSYFGNVLRQPRWLIDQYDDIFSNEYAIRLARRLCSGLIAQKQFSKVLRAQGISCVPGPGDSMLSVLNHITVIGALEPLDPTAIEPTERLLYENRIQLYFLDWARVVLMNDWNGTSVFPTNSAFAGALSLIKSMHDYQPTLVVGDTRFSSDYFSDRLDALEVPIEWLDFESTKHREHLLDHPYLFTPDRIVSYFRSINFSRMSRTFEESSSLKTRMKAILERGSLITNPHHKTVLQELLKTASAKYLVLQISRENVLKDAFDQLWRREARELLRPLKVRLGEEGGEEGFDSGGVQQEFFRLAIAECLDPMNGGFTIDERTHMAWFAPGSLVELWRYEMMGLLVSLAVFNGLTLPVTFPRAFYRKLLGLPIVDLSHIEDGWPALASGLDSLLDWDEDDGKIEEIFARTYEFSVYTYGSHVTREMTKYDSSWPQMSKEDSDANPTDKDEDEDKDEVRLVTGGNRRSYVRDYIRYLTDVSIRPQFEAFQKGFLACLHVKSLTLLDPPLLQSLVEGVQHIEIGELRRYTRYVGWDANHRTVRDFWSIVKRYDENMKRRLLEFVTASDRLPVGGIQNLQFVLQKNGYEEEDGGHLPTAYTCYGTLLLPEYKDKESLKERLAMALENAQGFGFA